MRFLGVVKEVPGDLDHPLIQWWLSLCGFDLQVHDEVAWCSAAVNGVAWDCNLPRSRSAAARSWLGQGKTISLAEAKQGNDVVIFWRGSPQSATGHVALFSELSADGKQVHVLGGNQGDCISLAWYPVDRVVGVRRIA